MMMKRRQRIMMTTPPEFPDNDNVITASIPSPRPSPELLVIPSAYIMRRAEAILKVLSDNTAASETEIRQVLGDNPTTSKALRIECCFPVKNNMLKWNCTPDVVSYNAIIDIICKGGLLDQALYLFSGMLRDLNVVPDVVAYNILIKEFGNLGRIKEANKLFDEMHDEMMDLGISPNTVTFKLLIDSHYKDGMAEDAWGLFELIDKIKISPDQFIYDSMMNGVCSEGYLEEAVKLFMSMVDRGLGPYEFSYNILIDGYCKIHKSG
ncbi:pentatricopeptide repeat-containing protein At5g41170, mitochondrial-like [Papaver somniferum]|nr:pentatricopeptide repeat-containing protein At5g41170, mitochondrial-like [Papaver somniferum]